jgi:hypothetical protein
MISGYHGRSESNGQVLVWPEGRPDLAERNATGRPADRIMAPMDHFNQGPRRSHDSNFEIWSQQLHYLVMDDAR